MANFLSHFTRRGGRREQQHPAVPTFGSGGGGGLPTVPLVVMRRKGVRGLRLVVDGQAGLVRLTLAPNAPIGPAFAWVETKRQWIEAQLAALPAPQPIVPGMIVPLLGEELTLDWAPHRPRRIVRVDDRLEAGGPIDLLDARLLRHLRGVAHDWLERETRAMAARHGVTVGKIATGDPRRRWGSCSSNGDIRYSWRLILAPEAVACATVAHELAHRRHMDHSAAFHRCVAEFYGRDPRAERRWLIENGARLHAFGRGRGEVAIIQPLG